jgi:formylglycine-generating enzyme
MSGGLDSGFDAGTEPSLTVDDIEATWVTVQAGRFVYGAPLGTPCMNETTEKQVEVILTHPFKMGATEVTRSEWRAMGFTAPPASLEQPLTPECDANCPVTMINWYEALAYANALSRAAGLPECYDLTPCTGPIGAGCGTIKGVCNLLSEGVDLYTCPYQTHNLYNYENRYECPGYRLPLVAEWEYAAKSGTTTHTYAGDLRTDTTNECEEDLAVDPIAWYCYNSGTTGHVSPDPGWPKPVGLKQPSPWGLYDMIGNAYEWVDHWPRGFTGLQGEEGNPPPPLVDPQGVVNLSFENMRNLRGGTFSYRSCAARASKNRPVGGEERYSDSGLRLVRTLLDH